MKYSITALVLTATVAGSFAPILNAGTHKPASSPVVITPPSIPDGSNSSRAPFPAQRRYNDVTPPNGEAFDQNLPPNTPSTTPEPIAPPPAAIAILQPRGEPGLMPTGRPTIGASAALDAQQMQTSIRSATFESRDQFLDNIRSRVRQSQSTMAEFRRTQSEMSAEGRTQFKAAADEVRSREKALENSIRAASRASNANWESARAQLAADYEAYAAALARVDTAAGITVR